MLNLISEGERNRPDLILPAAFAGRANTQLSTLTVQQARRYLKVQRKAFCAVLAVFGVLICGVLILLAWPLFVITLLSMWGCQSVIETWWKAHKIHTQEVSSKAFVLTAERCFMFG